MKQIILLGALIWLILSIIFTKKEVSGWVTNDLLQSVLNTIDWNKPTEKIFEWKWIVENLYQKSLDWQVREKAQTISTSLDKINFFNKEISIDKKDMINILFNSNDNIKDTINFLEKDSWSPFKPTPEQIKNSYLNIFPELKRIWVLTDTNDNILNRQRVNNWINSQFILAADNDTFLKEFNQSSLGEDLFMNWVADDSDYDLQIDIQNIWDLLFESFIAPVETVFYKMPSNYKWYWWNTSKNGSNWTPNNSIDKETLTNLIQNSINQQAPINTWIITNWWSKPWVITNNNTSNNSSKNLSTKTNINDTSLENFMQKSNLSQQNTSNNKNSQWNICIQWVEEWTNTPIEAIDTTTQAEIEDYLASIQDQISWYNNNSSIYPETPNISDNPIFDSMTPSQTNQFIENYIEELSDIASRESCINSCSSLPVAERTICQIQCLCFSMVWPDDPDIRVKSMNEMLKLRFCTVPAKSTSIPRWKNIYSLDDILNRIYWNMYNLINNWEMVKYQKTKEYLDNPIADLKFDKIVSFQMNINMKPIFNNKSDMAKKDQKETYTQKLEKATGKEQNLWSNYNKYLVIQDIAKSKAYKSYAPDLETYQENYQKEKDKLEKDINYRLNKPAATTSTVNISNITNDEKSKSLTTIADFLSQNLNFREQTAKEIDNLNNIIYSLQSRF